LVIFMFWCFSQKAAIILFLQFVVFVQFQYDNKMSRFFQCLSVFFEYK